MGKSLYEMLREYGASKFYPFHMPGHKRGAAAGGNLSLPPEFADGGPLALGNPFAIDLTEIDWNDNLHHAEGILKRSMEKAAAVYGAARSFYLVNGSTCGILAAIQAAAGFGGCILMARNCHRSAYHGVILNHLDVEYIYPQNLPEFGVYGGLLSEDIEKTVDKYSDIRAVFLTSPTYEGIVSDIGEISRILHSRGIPLIVDEAHGAHLTFGDNFPKSAADCGADVVIQSLHKTLPSLTQTAILHVCGDLVDPKLVEKCLKIYETSSPSYVFLASMENCIRYMDGPGRARMRAFGARVRELTERLQRLSTMRVMDDSVIGTCGVFDRDPSKIVIAADCGGKKLAEILRRDYYLETEMANAGYVLAMTSLMDSEAGLNRMERALFEIDGKRSRRKMASDPAEKSEEREFSGGGARRGAGAALWTSIDPEPVMPMWTAFSAAREFLPAADALGRTAADFVLVYPPGIPLLAPGERVTEGVRNVLLSYEAMGFSLEGTGGESGFDIPVVKG